VTPLRTQRSASHVQTVVASAGHELAHPSGQPGGDLVQTICVGSHVPHPHQLATHAHAPSLGVSPAFESMLVVSLGVVSTMESPPVESFAPSVEVESPPFESIALESPPIVVSASASIAESVVVPSLPESLPPHAAAAVHAASASVVEPSHAIDRIGHLRSRTFPTTRVGTPHAGTSW
jgi:hypothetical protein